MSVSKSPPGLTAAIQEHEGWVCPMLAHGGTEAPPMPCQKVSCSLGNLAVHTSRTEEPAPDFQPHLPDPKTTPPTKQTEPPFPHWENPKPCTSNTEVMADVARGPSESCGCYPWPQHPNRPGSGTYGEFSAQMQSEFYKLLL